MSYIKSRKHSLPVPAMLGLVASLPGLAMAQAAPSAADARETTLQTVKVTGQATSPVKVDESANKKYVAPLLDTPKTVNVIPAEVIQQTGSTSLVDALRTVPGISFGGGEGGNTLGDRPFIRGFEAQTSTYVDGLRDIAPSSREVFNIEQIEVAKGPDSTNGGRGAPGGSVNIYSKRPQAENFATGSIGLGTDKYVRLTGDVNFKIDDTSALRLNLMRHKNDVPGRDGPDASRWGFAPSLGLGLGTATRVYLSYYHLQTHDTPDGGIGYNLPSTFPTSGVVKLSPDYGGDRTNWYGLKARDYRKDKTDSGTVQVEHDFNATTHFRNVTRVAHNTMDYVWTQPDDSQGNIARGVLWRRFNSSIRSIDTAGNLSELSGELSVGGFRNRYVAGVEIDREMAHNNSYVVSGINYASPYNKCPNGTGAASSYVCTSLSDPNPNDPWLGTLTVNPAGNTDITTSTAAVYAMDTLDLTPQWQVSGGLRFDRYRTTQVNPAATVNNVANVRAVYQQNENLLNGQVGAVWKPVSNGSVYVAYGTSSTPAGSTTGQSLESEAITLVNSNQLDPERDTSLELGTKWNLFGSDLALTAAVFEVKSSNVRVAESDGTTSNAGDKTSKGYELGATGNLTGAWQVFAGYVYNNAVNTYAGMTNVGTTAAPNWIPAASTGRQFASTPKHSFTLWSTYKLLPALTLGGGLFGQSQMVATYAYASGTSGQTLIERAVPGWVRFDAMASYVFSRKLTVQLNVQNLTNRVYYTTASSPHYATMAAGRSAVLNFNFAY
jgi:catecholate siderophore receptor